MTTQPQNLLTVQEAAEALRLSLRTMYRFLEERRLPFYHIGRRTLVAQADLEKFREQFRIPAVGTLDTVTIPRLE